MGEQAEHRGAGLRWRGTDFVDVCACGWQTSALSTAGLAHSALDGHIASATATIELDQPDRQDAQSRTPVNGS